jgi:drug/metabolite transporter (DMT)-like permease
MGMTAVAGAVLAPVAAATAPAPNWSPPVVASVIGLTALSTAVAYLVFFRLIARVGATRTTTVTFLIPIFGVLGGHFLLGEPVGIGLVFGTALILTGVALVARPEPCRASPPTAEAAPGQGAS